MADKEVAKASLADPDFTLYRATKYYQSEL